LYTKLFRSMTLKSSRNYISSCWSFPHSWILTGFVTIVTRKVSLQEHMGSPTVLSAVRFGRSLVFCVVFLRALFVLLFFFWPLCCLSLFNSQILITPFGIFKLKHTRKYWSFENSNLTWSNISLLNNLLNHLVLYNDTYIEVLRSPPSIVV
jgi:hypothetical protein